MTDRRTLLFGALAAPALCVMAPGAQAQTPPGILQQILTRGDDPDCGAAESSAV